MNDKGSVRAMKAADVAAVGQLFLKVFRGVDAPGSADLRAYIEGLCFGSPSYTEAAGSLVYAQTDGRLRSALLAIPMRFVAHGREIPARLLCAYMTDAQKESAGAAALTLTLRARHQDLVFSDSASPTSCRHMKAVGGTVLSVQNLEWTRTFRPLAARASRLGGALPRPLRGVLGTALRALDVAIRARYARIVPPATEGLDVREMPLDAFLDAAPGLIAHYGVRPLWPREELAWLVGLAAQNTASGPLHIRSVHTQRGDVIGCFLYNGAPRQAAQVLNILVRKGKEGSVLAAMMHDLDQAGCTKAVGRAQACLMEGLATQPMLAYRHRAFVCFTTRHPDIVAAIERGDIYIGGLAGESWSRLMTDFAG